jgi:cytoskeletal protein RodZ
MMKKAGEILRETRLSKNLTVEEIYEGTKIRQSYIEAIENSNYTNFHSPTTIKGFLRNYAFFLNLNPENIIAVYRREQSANSKSFKKKWKFRLPNLHLSPILFVLAASFVIILSVIAFFAYKYIEVSTPPQFEIVSPSDQFSTTQDKITVEVLALKDGTEIQINNKTITTINNKGNIFTIVDLVEGENTIIVKAINGYKKETTKQIKVYRQTPQAPQIADANIAIKLTDTKPYQITYSIDDGAPINKTMNPGDVISFTSKTKTSISATDKMYKFLDISLNQSKVSLLQNIAKQEISYTFNKDKNQYDIKITALP